eukprot:CAMPEP_0119314500 /NCGR_PEP_ID=MMETSP1333-20130426/32946_1 /TAXON_ID=418940 /ORGANISM="Scyphosphaera apsteinii, Strain RCC1455" /LENGTH=355 /DNA_ID=CAMNT_0007319619 /DNA_START=23 /DNA_END=1090 /DNA_ORIENTATION=+
MSSVCFYHVAVIGLTLRNTLQGTYEIIEGTESVWQMPGGQVIKGLFVIAHGCQHSATDFWPCSPACEKCTGLPEEIRIVDAVLTAGWVPIAFSSEDRDFMRCWDFGGDGPRVARAVAAFQKRHEALTHAPVAAFGASSGGAFALQLSQLVQLKATVSQIMAIPPHMLRAATPFPPALFVHMQRDQRTASLVHKCVHKLRESGTRAEQLTITPLPVNASFYKRRVRNVSSALSVALHKALLEAGLIDAVNHMLIDDPRRSNWREAVAQAPGLAVSLPGTAEGVADTLIADQSALAEELNVAWAQHEIIADYADAVMRWIDDSAMSIEQAIRASASGHDARVHQHAARREVSAPSEL